MCIWRISWILPFSWLINISYVVLAYDLDKCPPPWQWKLRALAFCNVSHGKYSCLFDVIQHQYIESCLGKPDYVKPGKRYVIRGERDNDDCIGAKYQPFKLWSNRSSECEFLKSDCNGMGQVIANNGSTTKDRTCGCNYNKGFDFVVKPRNVCYCIPSVEDCSCYQKKCSSGEILTKDYLCSSNLNQEVEGGKCNPNVEIRKTSFNSSSTSQPILSLEDMEKQMDPHIKTMFLVVLLIYIISLSILTMILFKTIPPKQSTDVPEKNLQNKNSGDQDFNGEAGISNQIDQDQSVNLIAVNKSFLMEEMDIEIMRSKLEKKGIDIEIPTNIKRSEKAKIICEVLEKQPPSIMDTIYEILEENKLDFVKDTLMASERIFSYTNGEILKHMISHNLEEIVECLLKKVLVDKIIPVLKERDGLQQKVDELCQEVDNDNDKNKILKIIQLVMEDGLYSMLQFVYALFIVDEVNYETKLLRTTV